MARERYGLSTDKPTGLVWLAPDGKSILNDKEAIRNNSRRRTALNLSDSWNDFKAVQPEQAKLIGWNNFQKAMRGAKGSKVSVLQKFNTQFSLNIESLSALKVAADGDKGENNGWGDSG